MPKLKTHKATIKRVKISGTGKILRSKAAKSHLLTHKSSRQRNMVELSGADNKRIKRLIPYR
ncbi:50S ribosomal protein L35 [Candidatus Berkelbacteria bacterium RIFOXYA2_FULL_43_10]|uniref:Large ribosomal subunit protein bL35 n=1 Tax=Candidatus Berkelbacteria bacterium RIFOXYA2_FULL_43_10 TaxID=1797472 RepID=A0A1F5ED95_9BACT|nr:MAG: 50S ribosomal protein L35 [Candidatus Berkelbacteria bacterium RIFOXYA2_FULL_43_10]